MRPTDAKGPARANASLARAAGAGAGNDDAKISSVLTVPGCRADGLLSNLHTKIAYLAIVVLAFFLGAENNRHRTPHRSSSSSPVALPPSPHAASPFDPIHELRYKAAVALLQILQNDTLESAQESPLVDIGPLYDIIDRALDQIGFWRVFLELFETYNFTSATLTAAKDMGVRDDFALQTINYRGDRPEAVYVNVPSERFSTETDVCTACLPALHHWVGAIAAEKFVKDGSLLLDVESKERLGTAREIITELQRMTREETPPDMVPFHSQHGFLWQYVPTFDPLMHKRYPSDIVIDICGPLVWDVKHNKTFGIIPGLDVIRECIHGMGHAAYYVVANKQAKRHRKEWTARYQLRARGGFVLTDEHLCEAGRICQGAPTSRSYHQCLGGLKHAYYEVSYGPNMSIHSRDVLVNKCGLKP